MARLSNNISRYLKALDALDHVVAEQCGISDEHRDHMIESMTNDPILSHMRPMIAQRGLRVQPYADHSEGGRYALEKVRLSLEYTRPQRPDCPHLGLRHQQI